jgi:hypothetical protein
MAILAAPSWAASEASMLRGLFDELLHLAYMPHGHLPQIARKTQQARNALARSVNPRAKDLGKLLLAPLADSTCFAEAVESLGARIVNTSNGNLPTALIGTVSENSSTKPTWRVTWEGEVAPSRRNRRRVG